MINLFRKTPKRRWKGPMAQVSAKFCFIFVFVFRCSMVCPTRSGDDGFDCDFGTLDYNTRQGLEDCGVHRIPRSGWGVTSGYFSSQYGNDKTWKRNGGYFLTTRVGESTFTLPPFSVSSTTARLSFLYKFFGRGRSTLLVKVCGRIELKIPGGENKWARSAHVDICCYGMDGGDWILPEITFEARLDGQSGEIAVDQITVSSLTSVSEEIQDTECKVDVRSTVPPFDEVTVAIELSAISVFIASTYPTKTNATRPTNGRPSSRSWHSSSQSPDNIDQLTKLHTAISDNVTKIQEHIILLISIPLVCVTVTIFIPIICCAVCRRKARAEGKKAGNDLWKQRVDFVANANESAAGGPPFNDVYSTQMSHAEVVPGTSGREDDGGVLMSRKRWLKTEKDHGGEPKGRGRGMDRDIPHEALAESEGQIDARSSSCAFKPTSRLQSLHTQSATPEDKLLEELKQSFQKNHQTQDVLHGGTGNEATSESQSSRCLRQ